MRTPTPEELAPIRAELTSLAGGGKQLAPGARLSRGIGLYCSMTLPGLDDMSAVRDTKERLAWFGVPSELTGQTVLDIGSNEGSFSLEFAQRGATVTAVEYRADRVKLCDKICALCNLNVDFVCDDIVTPSRAQDWRRPHDLVWCACVTKFIKDENLADFYSTLRACTGSELLIECNRGLRQIDGEAVLLEAGFRKVTYLGSSGRRRKSYRAT